MNNQHLTAIRDNTVIPALLAIGAYSKNAEQLLMTTGMAESLFVHTRQIVKTKPAMVYGPAKGWFQMETATHDDLWVNYLGSSKRAAILAGLRSLTKKAGNAEEMVWNQQYAAAMCRIHYLRIREGLPKENDFVGMANYWKKYYNTALGKGTVTGFMDKIRPVIAFYEGNHAA